MLIGTNFCTENWHVALRIILTILRWEGQPPIFRPLSSKDLEYISRQVRLEDKVGRMREWDLL